MPKELSNFSTEMHDLLSEKAPELAVDIRNAYVRDMQFALESLIQHHLDNNINLMIGSHVHIVDLNQELLSRKIQAHFKAFTDRQLYYFFIRVMKDSSTINIALIAAFVNTNINSWKNYLEQELNAKIFRISQVANNLFKLISGQFLQQIQIRYQFDVYTKFGQNLNLALQNIIEKINIACDIEAIKSRLLQYTPSTYQHFRLSHFARTDPAVAVRAVDVNFFNMIQLKCNPNYIRTMTAPFLSRAAAHHSFLLSLDRDAVSHRRAAWLIQYCYTRFNALNESLREVAEREVQALFGDWLEQNHPHLLWSYIDLLHYNSGQITRRAISFMHQHLIQDLKPYYLLPRFLHEPVTPFVAKQNLNLTI